MSNNICKKPLVSILMAVYNPNYYWLKQQLISLNNQTYENLELIIYDDCSSDSIKEEFVNKYINKFNYRIIHGKINIGSNKAFEELTQMGEGEYFAYCDQDDIWERKKIEVLVNKILSDNSVVAYSDMSVIDKDGRCKYDTLIKAKPRIKYIYGENITDMLFFKNCISGCCMIINSYVARAAIPFSQYIVHDHWLCIVASLYGRVSFVKKQLVKYRIHGDNQTSSLKNIESKEDYYNLRVNTLKKRLDELKSVLDRINNSEQVQDYNSINKIIKFCDLRIDKNLLGIFKYRNLCKQEAYFEILIKYMPDKAVKYLLNKLK